MNLLFSLIHSFSFIFSLIFFWRNFRSKFAETNFLASPIIKFMSKFFRKIILKFHRRIKIARNIFGENGAIKKVEIVRRLNVRIQTVKTRSRIIESRSRNGLGGNAIFDILQHSAVEVLSHKKPQTVLFLNFSTPFCNRTFLPSRLR